MGDHYQTEKHESNGLEKWLWTKKGAAECARVCRRRQAKDFLVQEGLAIPERSSIESDMLSIIAAAFDGLTTSRREYYIEGYKIDLYLPEFRIAIECDEHGHKHKEAWEESYREEYIREQLSCQFVRFNPHESSFNPGSVINDILRIYLSKIVEDSKPSISMSRARPDQ